MVTKRENDISHGFGEGIRTEINAYSFLVDFAQVNRESITVSCGVMVFRPKTDNQEEVLKRVANALKRNGCLNEGGSVDTNIYFIKTGRTR